MNSILEILRSLGTTATAKGRLDRLCILIHIPLPQQWQLRNKRLKIEIAEDNLKQMVLVANHSHQFCWPRTHAATEGERKQCPLSPSAPSSWGSRHSPSPHGTSCSLHPITFSEKYFRAKLINYSRNIFFCSWLLAS